jgi:DNA-binding CsgD family transcriptional regulator
VASELEHELDHLGGGDIITALEEIPARAFIVGRDGVVRWQNAASVAAVGDLSGKRWTDVPIVRWAEEVRAFVSHMVCSGEPAEFSYEITEADGRVAWREISAAPLRDGDAVVGIFGISVPASSDGAPTVTDDPRLTGRQREILQLLAEGKSTIEIARELHLSTTTVRNHIAHLMANLGVHTRVQALIAARRAGIVRLP